VSEAGGGARTLLVASTGGHLEELKRLRTRLDPPIENAHWATADTEQSRELLAGESVSWLPPVPSKDARAALASLPRAARIIDEVRPVRVLSTGAALALPFFVAAHQRGVPCHYVESAARSSGPSLTGRLSRFVPGVRLYTQYPHWADARWQWAGSVFDGFEPADPVMPSAGGFRNVVVTLGTQGGFPFRRALESLEKVLPQVCAPGASILWQTGGTDAAGLGIDAVPFVPPHELCDAARDADLIIAHAGVGSALLALDVGRTPLLLPRRHHYGEHTDDHQLLIAHELAGRGLAFHAFPEVLTPDCLREAAAGRVSERDGAPISLN
jgi:UDP-N-acetylglucosamine--N-acetylmuramyl-(pentapeptide) pyrophosphoryl-undecaprenol N-acetylglucosamine transferase